MLDGGAKVSPSCVAAPAEAGTIAIAANPSKPRVATARLIASSSFA